MAAKCQVLRALDQYLGLRRALDAALRDLRDGRYVTHEPRTRLPPRVHQIAAEHEDANAATALRCDPTMQVVAYGPGVTLASQPTC